MITPLRGTPGVRAIVPVEFGRVFLGNWESYLPGGKLISSNSRDSGNTGYLSCLRAGLLMGKATSGGKYLPSILGISQNAYTSGGTTITVTAAQAVEIARRVGTSGNLTYVGPPAAAGTVAVISSVAFSAINTSTGAITVTSLGADLIAGGWVCSTDGTHIPLTLIPPGSGINVFDNFGNAQDTPFAQMPIGGTIDVASLPYWPTDTSLIQWVKDQLSKTSAGKFCYSDTY